MAYRVSTQVFEGPFDLLLQLVSKQKVDIGAISISDVVEQYTAEVERLGDLDLDVASDFLLVATTLLEIKAASLVPQTHTKDELDEDDDDEFSNLSADEVRDVLVARLIAYKQFKNAAAALNFRMEQESYMHPRTAGPDPEYLNLMPDYLENVTLRSLGVICADLAARKQGILLEAEHIAPKRVPLGTHMRTVDRLVRMRKSTTFSELLQGDTSPEQVVVTFLALLELFKRNAVKLAQDEPFGEISVKHIEGAPEYEQLDDIELTSDNIRTLPLERESDEEPPADEETVAPEDAEQLEDAEQPEQEESEESTS